MSYEAPVVVEPVQQEQARPAHRPAKPIKALLNHDFWMSFVLWKIRTERKLSQRTIAQKMDVVRPWITKIENGDSAPSLKSIFRYAEAFELDVAYIVRQVDFLVSGD